MLLLETKHPNLWVYGGHSFSNHHTDKPHCFYIYVIFFFHLGSLVTWKSIFQESCSCQSIYFMCTGIQPAWMPMYRPSEGSALGTNYPILQPHSSTLTLCLLHSVGFDQNLHFLTNWGSKRPMVCIWPISGPWQYQKIEPESQWGIILSTMNVLSSI